MADSAEATQEQRIEGIAVSPGIARGRVRLSVDTLVAPLSWYVGSKAVEREKLRFREALGRTREQIRNMQEELEEGGSSREHASIFDAHLLVLEDAAVIDEVIRLLETEHRNVDRVYYEVIQHYITSLRRIPDPYLRERAIDIEDVARRVLRNLIPVPIADETEEEVRDHDQLILVAHDLVPSDTVTIDRERVKGFATEVGSATSHAAILARSLNVPAVVGLHGLRKVVENGDDLLLDGYSGLAIVRPSVATLAEYDQFKARESEILKGLETLRDEETRTADGRRIILSANIEFTHEIPQIQKQGAEGVGLYRTEFFYLNEEDLRSERRQARNYAQAARAVNPHGVIIRTLDIGGDKIWPELFDEPEPNPFLGLRGIRVSLESPKLFKTQLRAVLRASAEGKVRLMYPFVSSLEELRRANELLEEARQELREKDVPFDEEMEVGVMIEIPSAVLLADELAREVDFFSIGTNDLIQYTIAVDRVNERVAGLYQPYHPAIIRFLKTVVEAAHRNGIWVGVCGEAAADLLFTPIFVGLEIDELSVGAVQLLRVRRAVSRLDTEECKAFMEDLLKVSTTAEVEAKCISVAEAKYPELASAAVKGGKGTEAEA